MIQASIPCRDSFLIICPWCFDAWARLEGRERHWLHRYVPCYEHPQALFPYGCFLAGSLLELDLQTRLLDMLPQDLIRREFELTMSSLLTKEIS
jgi:hypothetical protein